MISRKRVPVAKPPSGAVFLSAGRFLGANFTHRGWGVRRRTNPRQTGARVTCTGVITMSSKIDPQLLTQLNREARGNPAQTFPLIVTIQPGTRADSLTHRGLRIERIFEEISAVSVSANLEAVRALAKLEQVERIEFDGQMHTLGG
jgi:hypothetical protein